MTTDSSTVSSTKLKPCPFCGNEQPIIEKYSVAGVGERYRVACGQFGCGAEVSSGYWIHPNMAVRAWNRRADIDSDSQCESAQDCNHSDSQADSCADSQSESAQECKCHRWISVKDRLPDNNVDVLAVYESGTSRCVMQACTAKYGEFDENGEWVEIVQWCSVYDEYKIGSDKEEVTYWMPLPEPPKEEDIQ